MKLEITPESVSDESKESVRLTFNPSGDETVTRIKLLACALMTEYQNIRDRGLASREAAVAITNLQTASMWGVLAATKGKP